MIKANKECPSYDCGECETFPRPYSVKCGSEDTIKCKWLDFDFKTISWKEFAERK